MNRNFCLKSLISKFIISFVVALFLVVNFFPTIHFFAVTNAETIPREYTPGQPQPLDEEAINYTIFIKNATYSALYQEKVFFIDEDMVSDVKNYTLKAYDTATNTFESKTLSLTDVGEIVDVAYIDGKFFILSTNGIFYISITVSEDIEFTYFEIDSLSDKIQPENYKSISAYKYAHDSEYFLILTPSNSDGSILPELIILDTGLSVTKYIKLNITAQTDLLKIVTISSSEGDEAVYFLLVYEKTVSYLKVDRSSISGVEDDSTLGRGDGGEIRNFSNFNLESSASDTSVELINTIEIDDNIYLYITYKTTERERDTYKSVAYKLTSLGGDSFSASIERKRNSSYDNAIYYGLVSDNAFLYSTGQRIGIETFSVDPELDIQGDLSEVKNPTIKFTYYSTPNDFVYYQTNKQTYILKEPWNSTKASDLSIEIKGETDVIVIGQASIQNKVIEDYMLCFYSDENGNHVGFVETESLIKKSKLVEDGDLVITEYNKRLKVKPNAALYSLPTKAEKIATISEDSDNYPASLNPIKISNIKDNSKVECLDSIYYYTSTNSRYLKVKVNDSEEGYIESDSIIPPSNEKDFLITNSYIKEDGTNVYLEDSLNSPIIYILNAQKRVRINGTRNMKNGFTYITFNDEYGNEYSGYIKTDFIKSDGWSALQIAGCILIAINVGLLLLILYFRETRIGAGGQKYEKEKEQNKKMG